MLIILVPLWAAWPALKELAKRRQERLRFTRQLQGNICANSQCPAVGTPSSAYKKCSACQRVFYCSPYCQRLAWSTHKVTCQLEESYFLGLITDNKPPLSKHDYQYMHGIISHAVTYVRRETVEAIRPDSISTVVMKLDYTHVPVRIQISFSTSPDARPWNYEDFEPDYAHMEGTKAIKFTEEDAENALLICF